MRGGARWCFCGKKFELRPETRSRAVRRGSLFPSQCRFLSFIPSSLLLGDVQGNCMFSGGIDVDAMGYARDSCSLPQETTTKDPMQVPTKYLLRMLILMYDLSRILKQHLSYKRKKDSSCIPKSVSSAFSFPAIILTAHHQPQPNRQSSLNRSNLSPLLKMRDAPMHQNVFLSTSSTHGPHLRHTHRATSFSADLNRQPRISPSLH